MERCDRVVRILMSNGDSTCRKLTDHPDQRGQERGIAEQALFGDTWCPKRVRADAVQRNRRDHVAHTGVIEEAIGGNDDLHRHLGLCLFSGGFEHQRIDEILVRRERDESRRGESRRTQLA